MVAALLISRPLPLLALASLCVRCDSNHPRSTPFGEVIPATQFQCGDVTLAALPEVSMPCLRLRGGSSTLPSYEAGGDASGPAVFQVVEVPADRIGVLIGRAGSTIKELGRLAACKIWVDPQTNVPGYPIRYVNVQGALGNVEYAKRLIRERIENHGGPASDGCVRDTIPVPDHAVGAIIGKGGSGIKYIISMSGAKIFIPGESPAGSTERTVTVTGSPAMVAHAKQLIISRIPQQQSGYDQYSNPAYVSGEQQQTDGQAGRPEIFPPVGQGPYKPPDFVQDWRELYSTVEQQQQQQQHIQAQQQPQYYQGYEQQYAPSTRYMGNSQPRY